MPVGDKLNFGEYFSGPDSSILSQLSEEGQQRIMEALKEQELYGKHDKTTDNLKKNPENMSEKELKEGINDLLKGKKYNDLKNYLNGKDGIELPENESLSKYSHTVEIYNVSLNIWEDGFGRGTICDVRFPNGNEINISSLREIFSLLCERK